jgi:hypothetical protein
VRSEIDQFLAALLDRNSRDPGVAHKDYPTVGSMINSRHGLILAHRYSGVSVSRRMGEAVLLI